MIGLITIFLEILVLAKQIILGYVSKEYEEKRKS